MSAPPPKFIRIDGVKKINEEWKAWKAAGGNTTAAAAPAAADATAATSVLVEPTAKSTSITTTTAEAVPHQPQATVQQQQQQQQTYSDGVVPAGAKLRFSCAWDTNATSLSLDVDSAVSFFDADGMMLDCCFFNNLTCFNGAVKHSGDSVDGLAPDEDEVIEIDVGKLPQHVASVIFSWHCYQQGDFTSCKNAYAMVTVDDRAAGTVRPPTTAGTTSALILILTRQNMDGVWNLNKIPEEKGVGSSSSNMRTPLDCLPLMMNCLCVSPEMQAELRKSIPRLNMKKGSCVDLPANMTKVALGLGWDSRCDVDGSAVALGYGGEKLDVIYFGNTSGLGGAIQHSGDNTSGEGEGDDETINVDLSKVPSDCAAIFFTINVYSGGSFSQVEGEFCRLLDMSNGGKAFARINEIDSGDKNGFVFAALVRNTSAAQTQPATQPPVKWRYQVIGIHANGHTASELIDECQGALRDVCKISSKDAPPCCCVVQ